MRLSFIVVLVLGAPAALAAQHADHQTAIQALAPLWNRVKTLYVKSAEAVTEEQMRFKPTPEVRSFGEILGHVVNDHYLFCAGALGEENPNQQDFEKTSNKMAMVEAIKASNAYCDRAYEMSERQAMEQTTFFGRTGSKLWVLTFNLTHDSEHYGNLVTYFRLQGLIPPSSRQGM